MMLKVFVFFFQAEDGIRVADVTGVQTCALPILVRRVFDDSGGTYGAPRIQAELADDYGVRIGRKRVARLMKALAIEGVSRRRKRRYKTTIPAKEAPVAPDLVRRRFQAA